MPARRSARRVGALAVAPAIALGLGLTAGPAHAVHPRQDAGARRIAADTLTALPAAGVARPLRSQPQVAYGAPGGAAWQALERALGGRWQVATDRATRVPSRIWGEGLSTPGANGSAMLAEAYARKLLAAHLAVLAPGAAVADFVLVSNHSDGDQRAVGFAQRAGGRRVVGGQISFRFKRDRMFVIASEALPHVDVSATARAVRLPRAELAARTTDALRRELVLATAPVRPALAGEEVVLPLVSDDAVLGYRVATAFEIDGGADGRYLAYVDPSDGAVLAVHQQNLYANGTVMYRGVDRFPARGRIDRPAPRAFVTLGATPSTTTATGGVTWTPDAPLTVTASTVGDLVKVINKAEGGAAATAPLALQPGGTALWDASADIAQDAQVITFLATNTVKAYIRTKLDPAMPKLDDSIDANVNIEQQCNAFYDGTAINFFHATTMCQNTGVIDDVIFHEFGHALHIAEIVDGVGAFDGAMSEGAADFLAVSITGDSGMGRGFFFSDAPLRELDPVDREATWPRDIAEIHTTGKIFGGALWDLRKAAIAAFGPTAGEALVNRLYIGALRRSTSIPTSLLEMLATDDDDGNLANGTPNECMIRDAYGRHGLRTATGTLDARAVLDEGAATLPVAIALTGLSPRCAGDDITSVTLVWKPDEGSTAVAAGEGPMLAAGAGRYSGQLALPAQDAVRYQARVRFSDGSELVLPDNLGDPWYTAYQGSTEVLYCTGFDTNPFDEGWTTGAGEGSTSTWEWGAPRGGATDPTAAFSGAAVLAQNLGGDYPAKHASFVRLPDIDVGAFSDVRLQYRRWLAVEDSFYDQAWVSVNGETAWLNYSADQGESSAIHHIDREWRFHDVKLSGVAFGHVLSIGFDLATDEGLHLGGWAIDDLCVVANTLSICGDGEQSVTEECDDGDRNANKPNKCRTYCRAPACGDQIVDKGEACDDGTAGTNRCSATCMLLIEDDGGCCSVGTSGPARGSLLLAAIVGFVIARRRRRPA